MNPRCSHCHDTGFIPAPEGNAWRQYFGRAGMVHMCNVLVPCPACGGSCGKANRRRLRERLDVRKLNGTFPVHVSNSEATT